MADTEIRFDDGAAYEEMMGKWSRLAGEVFLDWLRPRANLNWTDVGCGNGAFTELLAERCAPQSIVGIDPSEGQLAYARSRHRAGIAQFLQGSAQSLPLAAASVDAASMALVIFFMPDPAAGVAEMRRVVRPGGMVATYAWDMAGDGFPWDPIYVAMQERGLTAQRPPRIDVSSRGNLERLWREAGLQEVATREIIIGRSFETFDSYWDSAMLASGLKSGLAQQPAASRDAIKTRSRALMPRDSSGQIVYRARANAAKGVVPAA
ncbi:MAG: class I SAM-dependent methyltransferase [Devosia sp.]